MNDTHPMTAAEMTTEEQMELIAAIAARHTARMDVGSAPRTYGVARIGSQGSHTHLAQIRDGRVDPICTSRQGRRSVVAGRVTCEKCLAYMSKFLEG